MRSDNTETFKLRSDNIKIRRMYIYIHAYMYTIKQWFDKASSVPQKSVAVSIAEMENYIVRRQPHTTQVYFITTSTVAYLPGTIDLNEEEEMVNGWLQCDNLGQSIVVYGDNSFDHTVTRKYNQLKELGFTNVKMYVGGSLEWALLQDVYGSEAYPSLFAADLISLMKVRI